MSSTFASFYRGRPVPSTAASSTDDFGRAYRGALGLPVIESGVVETAAGGLASGGSTPAALNLTIVAGGGFSIGGSGTASTVGATIDSFGYWRRGASISDSSRSPDGGFDYVRRGSLGVPVVLVGPSGRSYSQTAAGGASLGGSSRANLASTVETTAGVRLSGAPAASASLSASAGGGLALSGRTVGVVSNASSASGGWTLGGRSAANLSAVAYAAGGATLGGSSLVIELGYHIYMNDGHGSPIDYSTPVAAAYGATWTSGPLAVDSSYRFGVRAFFGASGLEEWNLDASIRLDLDADGDDVTWIPRPPIGPRATTLSGGRVRVEWSAVATEAARRPNGFRVYVRPTPAVDFGPPAAEVQAALDYSGTFAVEIGGLVDSTTYAVVVRAWNAFGEEQNANFIFFTADASPPSPIGSLQATPTSSHD